MTRRHLLLAALGAGLAFPAATAAAWIRNPCRTGLPPHLARHPAVVSSWDGIDPARVWDCHAHLAGTGDSDSGIVLAPAMSSLLHPVMYTQRLVFLNAACCDDPAAGVDRRYVERMLQQLHELPPGVKLMLLALDHVHDESGRALPERSSLHVPNAHARRLADLHPRHFEWVASVHPYRRDAVAAIEQAKEDGARAVKWLPPAMGIDPSSPLCDDFYQALVRLDLPLISHGGAENALHGANLPRLGNPLLLRRALDAGVRVVIAHCASIGTFPDLDNGGRKATSFSLFSRMMHDPNYHGLLFADISAITLINRKLTVIRDIIAHDDWHPRLVNGSDYPLPGVPPLRSLGRFVRAGMLAEDLVSVLTELQEYNPLLYDFVLKRRLHVGERRLPPAVFETRPFFARQTS